jgi:hypothetical protein
VVSQRSQARLTPIICGCATLAMRGVFGPDRPVRGGWSPAGRRPPGQVPGRAPTACVFLAGASVIIGAGGAMSGVIRARLASSVKLINLVGRVVCVAGQLGACAPGRRAEMTALETRGDAAAARRREAEGLGHCSSWRHAGSARRLITAGPANWGARGGEAYVALLWAAAFCCIMGRVWAVNGGQQV